MVFNVLSITGVMLSFLLYGNFLQVTYPLKGRNFRKHSLSLQNDDDDLYNPECPSGDQSPNFDPLQDTGQEKHEIKEISNQSRSRSNSPQEEQHPRMHSRSPEQRLGEIFLNFFHVNFPSELRASNMQYYPRIDLVPE